MGDWSGSTLVLQGQTWLFEHRNRHGGLDNLRLTCGGPHFLMKIEITENGVSEAYKNEQVARYPSVDGLRCGSWFLFVKKRTEVFHI